MTEPRFAPERIVASLNANRVRYVILGGLAVAAHGVVRATRDLDLVPESSVENHDRLATVRTWFEAGDRRVLVMWPRAFRAHWAPLEGLDAAGRVVAREGELVRAQGGYLKSSHPAAQHAGEPVFAAAAIANAS